MGATFILTLREAFEAALLLGIVYTYLNKIGCRCCFRYVTLGAMMGLVASVALGIAITLYTGPLLDLGPDIIGAAILFVATALLTWHGWWMQKHARMVKGHIQSRIDEARRNQQLWIVGLIAFIGVFREGSELVLFLWGLMTQVSSPGSRGAIVGCVAGFGAAAGLGWLVFQGGRSLSLRTFFRVTSILLLFLAAGLFSSGIGKLQGMGILPTGAPLWDTSSIITDRSTVGSFLSGLVGYRARPSAIEVAAYASYVLLAGVLLYYHKLTMVFRHRVEVSA